MLYPWGRPGLAKDSSSVLKLCETTLVEGYLSARSIPNIVYILRKELEPKRTRETIEMLSQVLHVSDFKASDAMEAANMMWADYEDAIQVVCARRVKADYIVTRNLRDFRTSPVRAVTPEEFLQIMWQK